MLIYLRAVFFSEKVEIMIDIRYKDQILFSIISHCATEAVKTSVHTILSVKYEEVSTDAMPALFFFRYFLILIFN